eukprot:jgi/Ulvmu1/9683/UM055_0021.1
MFASVCYFRHCAQVDYLASRPTDLELVCKMPFLGGAFNKDGWLTHAAEFIPVVNMIPATVHACAGNETEAARAATKGFATGAGLVASAAGGPAAGLAVGASLHGAASQLPKAFDAGKK